MAQVERDVERVKALIAADPNWRAQTERLGSGAYADVFGFASAAVKCERDSDALRMQPIEDNIALSRVGIERGIHFAPFLDYASCVLESDRHYYDRDDDEYTIPKGSREYYGLMPRINGVSTKSNEGLLRMLNIGAQGMKTYLQDYLSAHEIGFWSDDFSTAHNFLIAKNINMIDLSPGGKLTKFAPDQRQLYNHCAVDAILQSWHQDLVDGRSVKKETRAMFDELVGNTESALSSIPDSSDALARISEYKNSDFKNYLRIARHKPYNKSL